MGRGGRGGTHQEWAEAGVVEQIVKDFVVIDSVAAVAREAQLVIACRGENEIIKNTINYHRCSLFHMIKAIAVITATITLIIADITNIITRPSPSTRRLLMC